MRKKIERRKRIRKIGALVVLGIFVATMLVPVPVAAQLDDDWDKNVQDLSMGYTGAKSTGSVGIGIQFPTSKLHVVGDVKIDSGDLNVDSGTLFVDNNNNRVGIGTTSPDNPLELLSATTPQLRITNTDATDYATFAVDTDGQLDITTVDGGGTGGHICLVPDGRVGIGTTSPTAKTHIIQTDNIDPALRVDDEASDESPFVIDRNGDVGIGSTMPFKTHKLVIMDGDTLENRAGMYVWQAGAMTGGTGYGIYIRKTGASITNVAGFFNASGATNNYGLIVANGNVGIGTTSPDEKLVVSDGNLKMDSGNIMLNGNWLSGDGGSEGIYVDSSGQVGIGTTSPSRPLEIFGTRSDSPQLRLTLSPIYYTDFQTTFTGALYIKPMNNRVGIGTDSPFATLHIKTDGADNHIRVQKEGANNYMDIISGGAYAALDIRSTAIALFQIQEDGMARLHIENGGNVGIMTTTPGSRLEVKGAGTDSATSSLHVTDGTGASLLFVRDDGNVGIGDDSPGAHLVVGDDFNMGLADGRGDAYIQNDLEVDGNIYMNNDVVATRAWVLSQGYGNGDITAVGSMTSGAAFADSTADDDWLGLGSSAGKIKFDDQTIDEVNILDANVGIGDDSPGAHLVVGNDANMGLADGIGDVYIQNDLEADGNIYMGNNLVATQTWVLSQGYGNGDITAVGSMTSGAAFADSTADDDWLGLGSSTGRIEFDDQTTDEVNILGANVGIGTSTPGVNYKLHVVADAGDSKRAIHATSGGTTSTILGYCSGNGGAGVRGSATGTDGQGVYGDGVWGVYGKSTSYVGVEGWADPSTDGSYTYIGVVGMCDKSSGTHSSAVHVGVYGEAVDGGTNYAGYFSGDVEVTGYVYKAGGSFKIDHPLDPANKYLYHSFVESPDMMNIYNGEVVLDANGEAWVDLPEWFETINRDFRYQLTPISGPGPNLYIAQKVSNNRFKIAGGEPGMEVSWQVTGIRQDPWAQKYRIPVEEVKPEHERGKYLHPELYGMPETMAIGYIEHLGLNK